MSTDTLRIADRGVRFADRKSRVAWRGSWVADGGSRVAGRGARFVGRRARFADRGTRIVPADGFTLVEVLIAIGLFVTMAIGVAQLMAMAIETNRAAREHTSAVGLAASKMDHLIAVAVADGSASPPGTLARSVAPYVDYLNDAGRVVGSGVDPPGDAVFIRRWAIVPLPSDPDRAFVLSVLVTTVRLERLRGGVPWQHRTGAEALLVSIRWRQVP